MTYRELYQTARARLAQAGIDSPGPDALALTEHFFRLDRTGLALHGDETPTAAPAEAFLRAVEERAAHRPLQYILGAWEFMGLSLAVGEGVLCPREDTAVLVEALAAELSGKSSPRGVDLCAGTGAVALGLCSLTPNAQVTCLEVSPTAFSYLEKNRAAYPAFPIRTVLADVLAPATAGQFPPASLDFIASNPPYIAAGEIPSLQPEVQREPELALNGGEDGLLFYHAIADHWLPCLKPGGVLAVEIGETQGREAASLFTAKGLSSIRVLRDWAGLDRVVIGNMPSQAAH